MIALFCLLIPPLALVCLRERLLGNHKTIYISALTYAFSVLALNGILMFLLSYVFHSEDELLFKLNHHNGFACKYIIMSIVLAFAEPYAERFFRTKMTLKIHLGSRRLPEFRHLRIFAALYALVLFLLNFIRIFNDNFCLDETFSVNLIQHSLPGILEGTAADVHPPLYYLFLKAGHIIFGNQGWMFHLVSLIPYAIILIFALTVIWKKFGKEAAVILITLAGISNNAAYYSVEVRMYSWASLFVLLSFYELYNILSAEKNKHYVLFALFSLAAAYTHYYALISVAFFYVIILLLACRKKLHMKNVLITCLCTIVGYLPWFFVLLETFVTKIDTFWLKNYPGFKESMNYLFSDQFTPVCWGIFLLGIVLAFLYESNIIQFQKGENKKITISVTFDNFHFSHLLTWMTAGIVSVIGTITVGILVSKLLRPFWVAHYAYPVSIVAWMILGITISKLKGKKVYTLLIVAYLLLLSIPAYQELYTFEKQANRAHQATLAATVEQIAEEDVILSNNEHMWDVFAPYYYPGISTETVNPFALPALKENTTYWLFFINDNVPEMAPVYYEIEKQGFSYEQIVTNGSFGMHTVNVYRIESQAAAEP
ncbi:MAG: glycosyltransferase family 39 protein [Lachnospiraceae bacterium]|nr:glycosyltransferase family 39 protein [Lachnospiraceae bacterium]